MKTWFSGSALSFHPKLEKREGDDQDFGGVIRCSDPQARNDEIKF